MNLESTAEALRAWTPVDSDEISRSYRVQERYGQVVFGGAGVVGILAVIGLIYSVLTKMILTGNKPLVGILVIAILIFAPLALAYVILNENLKEKRKKARPAPPNELESSPVTGKLLEEKEFQPIPTVTENTTDLLPVRDRDL